MGRVSQIITSPHKDLVDNLLNDGLKVIDVYRKLQSRGIIHSLCTLYRYKQRYFIPKRKTNDRLYTILIETGNYNLLKSLERTKKIYETKRKCKCNEVRPEHLTRRGRVYIHIVCGHWYPYDLGAHLKNLHKKGRKDTRNHTFVAVTRSY